MDRLSDLLELRHWALGVLTRRGPAESDERSNRPPADPTIWRTFLDYERCATALGASLDERTRTAIGPPALAVLADFQRREARRILATRSQLDELGEVARETGTRIVVLKGALCIAEGEAGLDLVDIDILVPGFSAESVTGALHDRGYRPKGYSSGRHLRTLVADGKLPIEIHLTTAPSGDPLPDQVWRSLRPIGGWPDLRRLAPAEHLWHVLSHIAVDHPERRGRLRDLLLIQSALADCSEAEVAEVIRRSEADRLSASLRGLLEMARAIETAREPDDLFEQVALSGYLMRRYAPISRLPGALGALAWRWSFALTAGPAERELIWHETVRRAVDRSRFGFISKLESVAPPLGAIWRYGLRIARLPLVLVLAGLMAGHVNYTIFRFRESQIRAGDIGQDREGPMVNTAASSRVTSGT